MQAGPTQDFVKIEDVKDNFLIMKDNSLRGVMIISSLNFALKSAEEQEAIIMQFQNFLNSLDFPCQVTMQSRKLNMTGYFEKLRDLEAKQKNPLLKTQTKEYRTFIEEMVKNDSIMTKNFFVTVSFYLNEIIGESGKKKIIVPMNDENFARAKTQLLQRMEFTALGLKRCGLTATMLNSEELIELFWSLYHPREAESGYYPELPPELIK
jgi:type IV secretory pathway VirB4 component